MYLFAASSINSNQNVFHDDNLSVGRRNHKREPEIKQLILLSASNLAQSVSTASENRWINLWSSRYASLFEAKSVEPEFRRKIFAMALASGKKISRILCLTPPTQTARHMMKVKEEKWGSLLYLLSDFIFVVDFDKHSRAKRPCYHRMIHQSLTTKVRDILLGSCDVLSSNVEIPDHICIFCCQAGVCVKTSKITLQVSNRKQLNTSCKYHRGYWNFRWLREGKLAENNNGIPKFATNLVCNGNFIVLVSKKKLFSNNFDLALSRIPCSCHASRPQLFSYRKQNSTFWRLSFSTCVREKKQASDYLYL